MARRLFLALCGALALSAVQAAPFTVTESPMALPLAGGATLHGTLALPTGAVRPPVVLVIAGSGPTDRDGNNRTLPGHNHALRLLAAGLAQAGIASVRYDKRGVGESANAEVRESALRFDTYVDDAVAWLRQLQADGRFAGVGVVGHSEGALIGTLAARQAPAQALVAIAGPARRASVVLREQLVGKLPPDLAAASEAILTGLEQGRTTPGAPQALAVLYRDSVQPYLVSWFRYVPAEEFAALQVPALVVQGDTDIQIGVGEARALAAANPRAQLRIVPGMNHVLKAVPADATLQLRSYSDPALPLAPGLVAPMAAFLRDALAQTP